VGLIRCAAPVKVRSKLPSSLTSMLMSPSLLVEKNGSVPNAILSLLTVSTNDTTRIDSALAVSCLLFERESNVNNQKLMGPLTPRTPNCCY
jgi:hypothetical protein